MRIFTLLFFVFLGAAFCPLVVLAANKTITMTTYYPAPAGEYDSINATNGTFTEMIVTGNVGVGTTVPAAKLDVAGGVKVGSAGACTPDLGGLISYNSGAVQYCDNAGHWQGVGGSGSGGKAWVNFNGATLNINAGSGVSSVTRYNYDADGYPVGEWVIHWATPFSSANYAIVASGEDINHVGFPACGVRRITANDAIVICVNTPSGAPFDSPMVSVMATEFDTADPATPVVTESLGVNGYKKIGNLLLQWGRRGSSSNGEVSFAVTFPSAFTNVYNVQATVVNSDGNPAKDVWVQVVSFTTTTATMLVNWGGVARRQCRCG